MKARRIVWVWIVVGLSLLPLRTLAAAQSRRIAVIIGSNAAPPGRQPLHYAHEDAERLSQVLQRVGHFSKSDVHLLLDPSPDAVVRQLTALAEVSHDADERSMLFFYYSGHSDGQMVFPNGTGLPLVQLRELLERVSVRVRVGVLDTCRGGSWTQAKGLTLGPPLDAVELLPLATEGTALISSSSSFENAHEAAAVRGSFFTHYFAAGLLGAADRSGDGNVTLQEAFEYTKERTIRDTARVAPTTQHPSFDLRIRGRQDIVLSQVSAKTSTLSVDELEGPLEVIQLSSGITVLEIPPGKRRLRLALPGGKYMVRKVHADQIRTKEVAIVSGQTVTLAESDLEVTGTDRLAMKGEAPRERPVSHRTTLPRNWWELGMVGGTSNGQHWRWDDPMYRSSTWVEPSLKYGITDRLEIRFPLYVGYRLGQPGGTELVPRMGFSTLSYGGNLHTTLGASLSLRYWTTQDQSFVMGAALLSPIVYRVPRDGAGDRFPNRWAVGGYVGYRWLIQQVITIQFTAGLGTDLRIATDNAPSRTEPLSATVGSATEPLLRIHFTPTFSVDAYARWSFVVIGNANAGEQYSLGLTWNF